MAALFGPGAFSARTGSGAARVQTPIVKGRVAFRYGTVLQISADPSGSAVPSVPPPITSTFQMTLYRDQVVRVSPADLRMRLGRRAFAR